MKSSDNKKQLSKKVIYLFWLITSMLTLVVGWSVFNNIQYINDSVEIKATVYSKSSYRTRNGTSSSNNYSTALTVTYQFENPYIDGKIELDSELAPVMYAMVEKGDIVSVYSNEMAKPKTRLSHPLHFWLMPFVWTVFFGFLFYVSKILAKTNPQVANQYSLYAKSLLLIFFLPGIYVVIASFGEKQEIKGESAREQNWPRWDALERAVPKPEWWDRVAIKYFDPMDYTSEEYSNYLKQNTGPDKYHRQFKVTYAFLLLHQEDPLQMGWDLAKGTARQYMPLYEFFLNHFMFQEWQGDCSQPCSDATQMVEMAGDLLSMKLDENQIESSYELIRYIMKYKYSRGNNRGKYYFLYSYRRLLEHAEGKEKAKEVLATMVEENTAEALTLGLKGQHKKWLKFWERSQRKVGMFTKQ